MEIQSLILVVDDQPRGQAALASLLEFEGYRLAFAATGPEALNQMRLLAPDLVLLDVMMPEMDGFEVCRRIRSDPALALIPVIMVTALDDQASLLQGIEAGADDFITKPFNRAELRARVRTITRLNRFRVLLDEQRRVASERAQLLWAIERSADGYLLLDADDRPQSGNAQGWRYLGFDRQPDQGRAETFLERARRHYRLEPEEAWKRWPEPTSALLYLVRTEGVDVAFWLQVKALELPRGGMGSRLVHLHDVTASISAQRDIWTFHSFVSHKLRTPLTSLFVGLNLLMRDAHATLPDHLVSLAEISLDGARRLNDVVGDIFRHLEAPLILTDGTGVLLASVPDLVAQLAADMGILTIQIAADLGVGVYRLKVSDRTVELLLTELLENARKFHPRNTPTVQVTLLLRGAVATISVTDDGVSLTPAQMRRIWEPYQQIDSDFTGQVPGIGLGLTTVAQICWAAGGACRIANRRDGPGVTVDLDLPLAGEDLQAEGGRYEHSGDASSRR